MSIFQDLAETQAQKRKENLNLKVKRELYQHAFSKPEVDMILKDLKQHFYQPLLLPLDKLSLAHNNGAMSVIKYIEDMCDMPQEKEGK